MCWNLMNDSSIYLHSSAGSFNDVNANWYNHIMRVEDVELE
ncbi:MAG TPA: hypothetical protein VEY10_11125 [Flavisolibacter sp.]|nr:hypothetical protein [Flavisolibacter sp.]